MQCVCLFYNDRSVTHLLTRLIKTINQSVGKPIDTAVAICFQACKDTQRDPDFCIVARVEAFIAGWGLDEALKRAEAYRNAGNLYCLLHK